MIRREDGDSFLLITQHDHAVLSGQLAESFGNAAGFVAPVPFDSAIKGISLHDCGWPLHDDQPTLNDKGLPIDVFESSREIALKVWPASADRAAAADPYAGLLTSLHVLALSVFATTQTDFPHEKLDDPASKFAVAKFQQRELERQEKLRAQLGLRTEAHSHHAAEKREISQRGEDQLQYNFRLLQAMDQISLAACCTKPPQDQTRDIFHQPGDTEPIRLSLTRQGNNVVVSPWPFSVANVELKIPACRVPARAYKDNNDFRAAYGSCGTEVITCVVRPA